jgi:hypothetical protein
MYHSCLVWPARPFVEDEGFHSFTCKEWILQFCVVDKQSVHMLKNSNPMLHYWIFGLYACVVHDWRFQFCKSDANRCSHLYSNWSLETGDAVHVQIWLDNKIVVSISLCMGQYLPTPQTLAKIITIPHGVSHWQSDLLQRYGLVTPGSTKEKHFQNLEEVLQFTMSINAWSSTSHATEDTMHPPPRTHWYERMFNYSDPF